MTYPVSVDFGLLVNVTSTLKYPIVLMALGLGEYHRKDIVNLQV